MGWFSNKMTPVRESDFRLIQNAVDHSTESHTKIDRLLGFLDTQIRRANHISSVISTSSELGQELQSAIAKLLAYQNYSDPKIPMFMEKQTQKIQDLLYEFQLPRLLRSSIYLRRGNIPNHAEDINNNKTIREWITIEETYKADLSSAIKTIDKVDKHLNPLAQTAIDQLDLFFHI